MDRFWAHRCKLCRNFRMRGSMIPHEGLGPGMAFQFGAPDALFIAMIIQPLARSPMLQFGTPQTFRSGRARTSLRAIAMPSVAGPTDPKHHLTATTRPMTKLHPLQTQAEASLSTFGALSVKLMTRISGLHPPGDPLISGRPPRSSSRASRSMISGNRGQHRKTSNSTIEPCRPPCAPKDHSTALASPSRAVA